MEQNIYKLREHTCDAGSDGVAMVVVEVVVKEAVVFCEKSTYVNLNLKITKGSYKRLTFRDPLLSEREIAIANWTCSSSSFFCFSSSYYQ